MNSLNIFNELTARGFENTLGTPTEVQKEAWPVIAAGHGHTCVGSHWNGKTLSAFLVFIDRLLEEARKGTLKKELQLI
jgi:ATP-dependent Lhr-like helicase